MLLETFNKTHFNAKTKKNPYSYNISKEAQNYKPYKGENMLKYTNFFSNFGCPIVFRHG
jgi:hypothetical protein